MGVFGANRCFSGVSCSIWVDFSLVDDEGGWHARAQEHLEDLYDQLVHADGARRRVAHLPRQRVRGHPRSLGIGQDHPAQRRRRPRPFRLRRLGDRRHLDARVPRPRLGCLPQQPYRIRLPELQPHPASDRARQRRARPHAFGRLERGAQAARTGGADPRGARGPYGQASRAALGRADAARRHRARPHQRPRDPARRRADGCARLQDVRRGHGPSEGGRQRPPRHHGHAQPRARPRLCHAHRGARGRPHHGRFRPRRALRAREARGEAAAPHAHGLPHGARPLVQQPHDQEGPHPHDGLRGLDRHHRHRRDPRARERRERLHPQRRGGHALDLPAHDPVHELRHDRDDLREHGNRTR